MGFYFGNSATLWRNYICVLSSINNGKVNVKVDTDVYTTYSAIRIKTLN